MGTGLGGLASGVDEIYDADYHRIAEVHAGNGYTADGHEFVITARDVSEFDRTGAVVFSAEFPAGVNTYRAYRFDWK